MKTSVAIEIAQLELWDFVSLNPIRFKHSQCAGTLRQAYDEICEREGIPNQFSSRKILAYSRKLSNKRRPKAFCRNTHVIYS